MSAVDRETLEFSSGTVVHERSALYARQQALGPSFSTIEYVKMRS
uniref:Uncharacterized protein n=1 Tax=Anopheles quadriannulatus TaxID=34691 RepID=A0A182XSU8_ANOQN